MQIRWTRLPFAARNRKEFSQGLTDWLGQVFYERLPEQGYEVREEQIYTAFRIARALADGATLFAEAGTGTGKTFAYLLPAVCYARFTGKPVMVASATGVLQAQLASPSGDIQALSRLLGLSIDARLAVDPREILCRIRADRLYAERPMKGWRRLYNWTQRTRTGLRSEVPEVPDLLWEQVSWEPLLPCDTCRYRGTCHVMVARRHYRGAGDLVVTDHRLFALDLLTRAERQAVGQMPLLPPHSAVILDEGHHLPETWQRVQGHHLNAAVLAGTLELILAGYRRRPVANPDLAQVRLERATALVGLAQRESRSFLGGVLDAAEPGEGKRQIRRNAALLAAADSLVAAVEALQDELATEEAMHEGTEHEAAVRAYQARLDEVTAAVALFRSEEAVVWVEGEELWVVPRTPLSLVGPGRLSRGTPLLFSSATLEPAYMAQVLQLPAFDSSRVGVPFNLAEQVLLYQPDRPADEGDEIGQVRSVIQAMGGRSLVLLRSLAGVDRYRRLPWQLLCEGEADRGAMLEAFRRDTAAVLVGATFWEGIDVPGESLSCVIIPRLPFPAHDPLIRERRSQAEARGQDPFLAVDLPEMLLKLKQGAGRLIRTAQDRGVLALLDRSYLGQPWAEAVAAALPEGAEQTTDLARVAAFCPPASAARGG